MYHIYIWYIYLHEWLIFDGKCSRYRYTICIEHLGYGSSLYDLKEKAFLSWFCSKLQCWGPKCFCLGKISNAYSFHSRLKILDLDRFHVSCRCAWSLRVLNTSHLSFLLTSVDILSLKLRIRTSKKDGIPKIGKESSKDQFSRAFPVSFRDGKRSKGEAHVHRFQSHLIFESGSADST